MTKVLTLLCNSSSWSETGKRRNTVGERRNRKHVGCGINGLCGSGAAAGPRGRVKYFPASVFSFVYSTTQRFSLWYNSQMHSFYADSQREREAGMDRLYPLDLSSWETAGGVTLCNNGTTMKLRSFTSFSYLCLKLRALQEEHS